MLGQPCRSQSLIYPGDFITGTEQTKIESDRLFRPDEIQPDKVYFAMDNLQPNTALTREQVMPVPHELVADVLAGKRVIAPLGVDPTRVAVPVKDWWVAVWGAGRNGKELVVPQAYLTRMLTGDWGPVSVPIIATPERGGGFGLGVGSRPRLAMVVLIVTVEEYWRMLEAFQQRGLTPSITSQVDPSQLPTVTPTPSPTPSPTPTPTKTPSPTRTTQPEPPTRTPIPTRTPKPTATLPPCSIEVILGNEAWPWLFNTQYSPEPVRYEKRGKDRYYVLGAGPIMRLDIQAPAPPELKTDLWLQVVKVKGVTVSIDGAQTFDKVYKKPGEHGIVTITLLPNECKGHAEIVDGGIR